MGCPQCYEAKSLCMPFSHALPGVANSPAIASLQLPLSINPAGLGLASTGIEATASTARAAADNDSTFEKGGAAADESPAGTAAAASGRPLYAVPSQAVSSSSHQASAAELARLDGASGAANGSMEEGQQPGLSNGSSSVASSSSSSGWLGAFSQAPLLVEAYGSNLPELLHELLPAQKSRAGDSAASKQQ